LRSIVAMRSMITVPLQRLGPVVQGKWRRAADHSAGHVHMCCVERPHAGFAGCGTKT
jgi:hypothetical protein